MRWLKHMTASWGDEKMARLTDKGGDSGLAAYGLYWRVQEVIAAKMEGKDPDCSVQYSISRWASILGIRGSDVERTLRRLDVAGLSEVSRVNVDGLSEPSGTAMDIRVTNRNLLKYRDEYSKKSGHSTDNVPPRTEAEVEGEVKTETKKEKSPSRNKSRVDSRHGEFRKLVDDYWQYANEESSPWGPAEAKQLKNILSACPGMTSQRFKVCLNNRHNSEDTNPAQRPSEWLSKIPNYESGPLDRFGKLQNGGKVNGKRTISDVQSANLHATLFNHGVVDSPNRQGHSALSFDHEPSDGPATARALGAGTVMLPSNGSSLGVQSNGKNGHRVADTGKGGKPDPGQGVQFGPGVVVDQSQDPWD